MLLMYVGAYFMISCIYEIVLLFVKACVQVGDLALRNKEAFFAILKLQ